MKSGNSGPADVAIYVESALVQLAERDYQRRPAIAAAAWPPATAQLPSGTLDRDRNIDSTGAVETDSHTPCEDIVEQAVDYFGDDWQMLSYLGM